MNILVVDDSKIMRNIIKNTLRYSGNKYKEVNFFEAQDGVTAFREITDNSIDLMLLDWNMPRLNGLDLVRKLRKLDPFKDLPIIMITSEAAKYNVIEAVKAGVSDYIVKPVPEKKLIEKIERLLFAEVKYG